MRWTRMLIRTLRERPDASLPGLQRLLQAGYVRAISAGVYDWPPLGTALRMRLVTRVVAALEAAHIPLVTPSPWRGSATPMRLDDDRSDGSLAAWYTPALLALAAEALSSYKQLPQHLATVGYVHRDEPRPRAGLLRARAFTVLEGLSLAASVEDAHEAHALWERLLTEILEATGVPLVRGLRASPAGPLADIILWPHQSADTTYLHCPRCNAWYHPDVAPFVRPLPPDEELRPMQEVETPDCTTIEALCAFLDVPPQRTAKAMFLVAGERLPVIAIVRGDTDLSLAKLRRVLGYVPFRPATPEEIRSWGAEPGYGSPVGTKGALIVIDTLVAQTPNLVSGANRPGYHLLNVNPGRDYRPHVVADIARGEAGTTCPACGTRYEARPAWVLAEITRPFHPEERTLSPAPDAFPTIADLLTPYPVPTYLHAQGRPARPWLVRATLGVERVLAAAAEVHHNERGLAWPSSLAPFDVHLIVLPSRREPRVWEEAERLYERLTQRGMRVLFDDRDERAGVKFNDADLLGIPTRITVSERGLRQGAVEVKPRGEDATWVTLEDI